MDEVKELEKLKNEPKKKRVWTSTTNQSTMASEDTVFGRAGLARFEPKYDHIFKDFSFDKDYKKNLRYDFKVFLGKNFFPSIKYVTDLVSTGNDYGLRKVTLAYDGTAFYVMGGKNTVMACLAIDIIKSEKTEPFFIEISYDELKPIVKILKDEFHAVETCLMINCSQQGKVIFAVKSEDKRGSGVFNDKGPEEDDDPRYTRYVLVGADSKSISAEDSDVLGIFSQYEDPNSEYQPMYTVKLTNSFKSLISDKPDNMELVQRRGLLTVRKLQEKGNPMEIYTESPVLTASSDIPSPKDGEAIAALSGRELYDVITLHQDLAFTIDILGKKVEGQIESPFVKIDGDNIKVLISQNLKIPVQGDVGFLIKKGSKFQEATEEESIAKAQKRKPKEIVAQVVPVVEGPIEESIEKPKPELDTLTVILNKLEAMQSDFSKVADKVTKLETEIFKMKEAEVEESPDMAKVLSELPGSSKREPFQAKKDMIDYLVLRKGEVVHLDLMHQDLPYHKSNMEKNLDGWAKASKLLRLAKKVYYIPEDAEMRLNAKPGTKLPPVDREIIPDSVKSKYKVLPEDLEEANE